MKVCILLLAAVGVACGAVIHRGNQKRNLHDDLEDFLALIPVDQIKAIALDYLANDAEVQQAVAYLRSDDFKNIVAIVDNEPETKQVLNFLVDHGLDAYAFLNRIHDLLGIPHVNPVRSRHTRSIRNLIDDIKALLPIEQIRALYHEKLETSPDFKNLYDTLSSDEFHNFILRLKALPEVQELVQKLRDHGIDVDKIVDFFKSIFGWNLYVKHSTRNLHDDLMDFVALVPVDQIKAIALDYLANDAEVQQAVAYLRSDEFKNIVAIVDNEPETKQVLNFLVDHGLDAYAFLNRIHDLLGIPHVNPVRSRHTRSIRNLIDDIKALLPIEQIRALYHEKLETSPDFKNLYDTLSSEDFHNFILRLKALPEVQDLVQKLRDHGIDVDKIVDFFKSIFGWNLYVKHSTRNLHDDLMDFVALVPVDQIKAIALDYLANDAEVQQAVAYLRSDDFKNIVAIVDNEPETKQVLNFLVDHGLDAYAFLNRIHDLLGIPHVNPVRSRHTRSIRNLIDDIKALLPIEEIRALYHEKLETSPDFKNLYDTLSSEDFHNFILKLKALPEVQDLVQKLRDHGIDVDKIVDFFKSIFGWNLYAKHSTRNLHDDLMDFVALVPVDQIKAIALDYLANDAEVQQAVAYLRSDEFKNIVAIVDNEPETKQVLNFLVDHGLDAYAFLNRIHDLLGIPHVNPVRSRHTRSIRNLIDDIKALLPIEEIRALYHEKLETSPDFKNLYDTLSSEDFHNFILRLKALPEVQDLVQKLRDHGIDVDKIVDFFKSIFGWNLYVKHSTRNLHDDLMDFVALVPVDQIKAIALDYLANDAEVQQAVAYLRSDDFKNIVAIVDNEPETKQVLNFLVDHGLDAYAFLNRIHDLLGIPHVNPVRSRHTRSIRNLIDDIKALLPIEEIRALYHEKLETSPDFKNLYDTLSSEDFHNFILKLKALPEVQDLVQKLRDHGIDVDKVVEFFKSIFGWNLYSKHSTRNLHDDLMDFVALVPVDQVKAIALDYLANDAEVQQAIAYLRSDDFKNIVAIVDNEPETKQVLNFLVDHGLDAYAFLNRIHDFLGLPHVNPVRSRHTRSIRNLIDDIKALLPIEKIRALYHEKMESSPDFKNLYDTLSSQEFHNFILKMKALPEVQELVQKLRDHGIDVDKVVDFIKTLFGWQSGSCSRTFITAKMKVCILLLAAVGLACGAVIHRDNQKRNLHDDLEDFLAIIPIDQIKATALDYLANDAEVQQAVAYLRSDDFKNIVAIVDNEPETKQVLNFLVDHGLDAYTFLNRIHDLLGIPHVNPVRSRHTRSIRNLIDDIKALLPIEQIRALYHEKLETSPDFKNLYDTLSSDEFHNFILRLKALPEVQELVQKLRDHGIDVDKIVDFFKSIFGWNLYVKHSTRNLHDDLMDFVALVPVDQIKAIALDYLANDAEVQQAVAYLRSDDFKNIVAIVDNEPETKQVLNFLVDHGLDAYTFLNRIHDLLGIPHVNPVRSRHTRSIRNLIDDIKALLPIEQIRALYHEKLETSPDFKNLYDTLSSDEFHNFILRLKAVPEVQELVQKLRDHGIDVDKIVDFFKSIFGWNLYVKHSTRNLHDDLMDFVALVPVDQIKAIALDYLANDAEVQQAVAYLRSDDFKNIVAIVDNEPETKQVLNFLVDHGLDAYTFLNRIHDLLGIPHVNPVRSRHTRSIRNLIDDIKALLPIEQIRALYHEKLETSPDFKNLYDTLSSDEFHNFILRLKALPEVQELVQKLRDHGIDVDKIVDFFKSIFGWNLYVKHSTRNLHDDLMDFVALVPVDQIKAIALDYLANDAEVQQAVAYLRSDDFKNIVAIVDNEPETKQVLNFLVDHGLDAYTFLNRIHDLLGIPHVNPVRSRHTRSIRNLIDDIKALLPIEQIRALYHEKLETSPDFKNLYDTLSSDEFHNFILRLKALPEVQELVQKLRDHGIDVDKIVDFFKSIFGWNLYVKHSTRNLHDDLMDFVALVPVDQIKAIALDYLANDAEVQQAVAYLRSDDFKNIVAIVDNEPETKQVLNFLVDHGLDAYTFLNRIHDLLGIPHVNPVRSRHTRSIRNLIDDIKALLPIEQIRALYHEKLETSPDFKNLYDTLSSDEFHNFILRLKALPEVQELVQKLRDHGIDVDKIVDFFKSIFGWNLYVKHSTRNLHDDLMDFVALVPVDQIKAIALDYLANDAEVQQAVAYLRSDDFKNIVAIVDNEPETKQVLNFLVDHGLDAYTFLNRIHDLLGIPHVNPVRSRHTRSIRNLIDDIKALLPIEQIRALYHEKLETSPDFKNLYDTLSSDEFHNFILRLKALPEVQELVQKLRDHGIDVDKIVDFFKSIFGWNLYVKHSTRNLHDDLMDFVALVPVDQIKAIALDYLANDAEVQQAVAYLRSDDFKNIVAIVDNEPETKQVLNFLVDHGLDAYTFLNRIHDLLGIPHVNPVRSRHTRSIRNLIDDIKALLPIEQIRALYHEKLETSPDFKNLYDTLSSDEFHNFILRLKALPEVQELVQKLRDHGIDVDKIVDFFKSIFGWNLYVKHSTRNLHDDLMDFVALVPVDQIKAIALDYLANDAEVQQAVAYLRSDDFKNIVAIVDNEPETKQVLNFLVDHGLDAYTFLNRIHDLLGIPHVNPVSSRHTRSIRNLIDDIKALLPIEQIRALYHEKLETSPDFKNLYDTLSSEEFHNFVLKLKALPEVQELVQKLRDHGIDVDKVVEFIKSLFGWQ
ncbi:uncharacterized protein [Anabrus simplex]|uniref:uncharacterized protein n=1 Tax=Anabrus simplex TaxID=316456 RepID=UPI0035A38072